MNFYLFSCIFNSFEPIYMSKCKHLRVQNNLVLFFATFRKRYVLFLASSPATPVRIPGTVPIWRAPTRSSSQLAAQLGERMTQRTLRQRRFRQLVQLFFYQLQALFIIIRITCPIDAPIPRVTQRRVGRFDRINEPFRFPQTQIQTAVQTPAAQDIVQKEHRQLVLMPDLVRPST